MVHGQIFYFVTCSSFHRCVGGRQRRNVYAVFHEFSRPPGSFREEEVTVRIKRHMANLLYPVDLTSFEKPEKDTKFREMIMTLQKQMGEPSTGILTSGQFNRLAKAAKDIEDRPVSVGIGKLVYRSDDGNLVEAVGTGARMTLPTQSTSLGLSV
jgi:hypothetical protein